MTERSGRLVAVAMCLVAFSGLVWAQPLDLSETRRRAERGDAIAQYNMGVIYANGENVARNPVLAHMWVNLAASRSTGELRDQAIGLRASLEAQLNPTQRAEARLRARQWEDAATTTTLYQAIESGIVRANFRGTGGSTGDTIEVVLAKTPKAPSGRLRLMLSAGSMLRSEDPATQNMVLLGVRGISTGGDRFIEETTIVLADSSPLTYVLSAFCAEFEKDNPSATTEFTLVEQLSDIHACILETGVGLSINAIQAAIWMATDSLSYDEMNERLPLTVDEWNAGQEAFGRCSR